ncbi:MAG: hypothetical protein HUJ61_04665 [Bacilli bacterium]|nr:hypothetical protein [Bacilli bacterium]
MSLIVVNGNSYVIEKELNRTSSYIRYLVSKENKLYILKDYTEQDEISVLMGGGIQSEINDYFSMSKYFLPVSRMADYSLVDKIVVREYIEGTPVDQLFKEDKIDPKMLYCICNIAKNAEKCGLILDYDPANFIWYKGTLYYSKFWCKKYNESKSFENYGIMYWIPGLEKFSLDTQRRKKEEFMKKYGVTVKIK